MTWKYNDTKDRVVLTGGKPSRVRKLTGTRFAAALGYNTWKSPFEIWCEVTNTAQVPFVSNKYTEAGMAIEGTLIENARKELTPNIVTPEEYFGKNFNDMRYDYYPSVRGFGGMWDALALNANGDITAVIECKTTKRVEDWFNGVPTYYALQGLLYAFLLGVDDVYFPVAFLREEDYAHPERFEVTEGNSAIYHLKVSEYTVIHEGKEMAFPELYDWATEWLDTYVATGVSPTFDEVRDKEILRVLRSTRLDNDSGLDEIVQTCDELTEQIEKIYDDNNLKDLEKQLKMAKDALKRELVSQMDTKDTNVSYAGWQVTRSFRKGVDKSLLEADGLLAKYETETIVETLRKAKN